MEPTQKSDQINDLLSSLMGKSRTTTIQTGGCMTCDKTGLTETSFRNDISRKEYTISGMCQACQDDVFGTD